MIKYDYKDYLFISSRIHAMEKSLISLKAFASMARADSLGKLYAILEECGVSSQSAQGSAENRVAAENNANAFGSNVIQMKKSTLALGGNGVHIEKNVEKALSRRLHTVYLDILKGIPSPELFTFFTYPYDCNNLKVTIKCVEAGISPDSLLLPYGTVTPQQIKESVRTRNFSAIPENMARGALKAIETFAKSRAPQDIDLILDRAVFLDIQASVSENPIKFFKRLLTVKADTVNVLSAARIVKMHGGIDLFQRAFVTGGALDMSFFIPAFENGMGALSDALLSSVGYAELSQAFSDGEINTGKAEAISEKLLARHINTSREVLAGAEVVARYIAATEAEVKNVRLLISGKTASFNSEKLFEGLCKYYVV